MYVSYTRSEVCPTDSLSLREGCKGNRTGVPHRWRKDARKGTVMEQQPRHGMGLQSRWSLHTTGEMLMRVGAILTGGVVLVSGHKPGRRRLAFTIQLHWLG